MIRHFDAGGGGRGSKCHDAKIKYRFFGGKNSKETMIFFGKITIKIIINRLHIALLKAERKIFIIIVIIIIIIITIFFFLGGGGKNFKYRYFFLTL